MHRLPSNTLLPLEDERWFFDFDLLNDNIQHYGHLLIFIAKINFTTTRNVVKAQYKYSDACITCTPIEPYIHCFTHIHVHVYIHTYMHRPTYYINTYMHTYTYVRTYIQNIHRHTSVAHKHIHPGLQCEFQSRMKQKGDTRNRCYERRLIAKTSLFSQLLVLPCMQLR